MEFSAIQISQLLDGEIVGDSSAKVTGLSKIDDGKQNTLSFLANPAYTEFIYTTKATVVIVGKDFVSEKSIPASCTLIKVEDPYSSFAKLLEMYNQIRFDRSGISKMAYIDEEASIGDEVYIGPGTVVEKGARIGSGCKIYGNCFVGENVIVGENCIIHAGTSVLAECRIGNDCVMQPGVIIGGDGFGFSPNSENNYHKVPQIGNVIIEDHVEIGANTTIDRATLGSTIIRKGVKIDNLIQVAHNVEIGENTVIAAQTGVAGSTKIGKNCMIGGQVGIIGHLNIGDGVKIAAQSGVTRDITEENSVVQGSPSFGYVDYKKSYIGFKNLPQLMKEIKELRAELASLKRLSQE